jgi:hypothetical protein
MLQPLAVWLLALTPATATHAAHPASPFDFSTEKTPAPQKGLVRQLLYRIDGGDFHGYDATDGTSHKAENPLHTMTVRLKLHF